MIASLSPSGTALGAGAYAPYSLHWPRIDKKGAISFSKQNPTLTFADFISLDNCINSDGIKPDAGPMTKLLVTHVRGFLHETADGIKNGLAILDSVLFKWHSFGGVPEVMQDYVRKEIFGLTWKLFKDNQANRPVNEADGDWLMLLKQIEMKKPPMNIYDLIPSAAGLRVLAIGPAAKCQVSLTTRWSDIPETEVSISDQALAQQYENAPLAPWQGNKLWQKLDGLDDAKRNKARTFIAIFTLALLGIRGNLLELKQPNFLQAHLNEQYPLILARAAPPRKRKRMFSIRKLEEDGVSMFGLLAWLNDGPIITALIKSEEYVERLIVNGLKMLFDLMQKYPGVDFRIMQSTVFKFLAQKMEDQLELEKQNPLLPFCRNMEDDWLDCVAASSRECTHDYATNYLFHYCSGGHPIHCSALVDGRFKCRMCSGQDPTMYMFNAPQPGLNPRKIMDLYYNLRAEIPGRYPERPHDLEQFSAAVIAKDHVDAIFGISLSSA